SGVIPQISVIMGPSAGGAVYSPAITDFVIMVEKTSQMFITGPKVIETVTGEQISAEELGGAHVHNTKSGNAHLKTESEEEALDTVRELLEYLPANYSEKPPIKNIQMDDDYCPNLTEIVPYDSTRPYAVKNIIHEVVDHRSFFDIDSSDKSARFIRLCDSFNIPIITFEDVTGFFPGVKQEHGGIIRHGAKILYAYSEATVPKITVITRKAYGGAYVALNSKSIGADLV